MTKKFLFYFVFFKGHSVAKVEDKFYLFGGRTRNRRMNDLYSFDLKTRTWTKLWDGFHPPDVLRWLEVSVHDGILDTEDGAIVPEPRVLHSFTWSDSFTF